MSSPGPSRPRSTNDNVFVYPREAPFLTHRVKHLGHTTLIPPENSGRRRRAGSSSSRTPSPGRRSPLGAAGQTPIPVSSAIRPAARRRPASSEYTSRWADNSDAARTAVRHSAPPEPPPPPYPGPAVTPTSVAEDVSAPSPRRPPPLPPRPAASSPLALVPPSPTTPTPRQIEVPVEGGPRVITVANAFPSSPQSATSPHFPLSPNFPFGIVSTDPSTARRPLPQVPQPPYPLESPPLSSLWDQTGDPWQASNPFFPSEPPSSPPQPRPPLSRSASSFDPYSNLTELDVMVSRLETGDTPGQGLDYDALLTLEEIIGPAARPFVQVPGEPSRRLHTSTVKEDSRRVTKEGRVKVKLSLDGVRVERCGICLSQFKADVPSVMLKCKHGFHASCLERWVKTKPTCPTCRASVFEEVESQAPAA